MSVPHLLNGRQPHFEPVSEIFQRVKGNVAARTEQPEFAFGLPELDELTRGILRGKITVLAARSSEGKTSLCLQTAWRIAESGKTVAYISLEDDREELVERLFCQVRRVDNQALRRGEISSLNDSMIEHVFRNIKLLVMDDFGYSAREVEHIVMTLDPKPDVALVDYVQMVDDGGFESEYRAISQFVRQMKVFAEKHDIAVVLASQINRTGAQDGQPQLHHLARCGRLEEVANLVLLLYWPFRAKDSSFDYIPASDGQPQVGFAPESCPMDYFELCVGKNKTGPKGTVRLRFIGQHYRFEPWNSMAANYAEDQQEAFDV